MNVVITEAGSSATAATYRPPGIQASIKTVRCRDSYRHGLNDRETRSDFDDPLHAKPCISQQGRELIRCAFLSVRGHEHVQIGGFRLKAVIRTPDDPFYDQSFASE